MLGEALWLPAGPNGVFNEKCVFGRVCDQLPWGIAMCPPSPGQDAELTMEMQSKVYGELQACEGCSWGTDTALSPEQATLEHCISNSFFQHCLCSPVYSLKVVPRFWKEGMGSASPQPTRTEPEQPSLLFLKKLSARQTWQREFLRANPFYCISTSWLGEVGGS